jgi:hypothetical protein
VQLTASKLSKGKDHLDCKKEREVANWDFKLYTVTLVQLMYLL